MSVDEDIMKSKQWESICNYLVPTDPDPEATA